MGVRWMGGRVAWAFAWVTLLFWLGLGPAVSVYAQSSDSLRRYEFSHPQMGTVFRLVFYTSADSLAQAAARATFDRVDTLNAILSDYRPDSELMRLCDRAGSGEKVPVSAELWRILRLSSKFSRQSKGAFDVTVGPLTRLWRRARNLQELPDSSRVDAARALVDWRQVKFYRRNHRIELTRAGMKLDLGGIGQGFAADECLRVLGTYGITRALADAGGDIALGDAPPGTSGWRIETPAEEVPISPSDSAGGGGHFQMLANCGITTSGTTYRYLEAGGRRYSHIVDPHTGWGLTHRVLVTVQAPNATEADAWATAISVLGPAGWAPLRRRQPQLRVWVTAPPW